MSRIQISGLRAGKLDAMLAVDSKTLFDLAARGEATLYLRDERESRDFRPINPVAIQEARLDDNIPAGESFAIDDGPELEGTDARAIKISSSLAGPDQPQVRDNKHWVEVKLGILSAALQVISEGGRDYFKGQGSQSLNADTIAGEIDDQRHRWPNLKNNQTGTSRANILAAIRKALAKPGEDGSPR